MIENEEQLKRRTAASVCLAKRESPDPLGPLKNWIEPGRPRFGREADMELYLTPYVVVSGLFFETGNTAEIRVK